MNLWLVGRVIREFETSGMIPGLNARFIEPGCYGLLAVYETREAALAASEDGKFPIFELGVKVNDTEEAKNE
jgi:hypothetical protein